VKNKAFYSLLHSQNNQKIEASNMARESLFKAAKGLIRVKAKVESGNIREIQIAGDFFMYPEDELWKLEQFLVGTEVNPNRILTRVKTFYKKSDIITPGVIPEDFAEAIVRAVCSTLST